MTDKELKDLVASLAIVMVNGKTRKKHKIRAKQAVSRCFYCLCCYTIYSKILKIQKKTR
jgi:hypothetical protein